MIIRSAGKTVYHRYLGHCLAGELATGTAMKVESICRPLGGEEGSVRPTSHQWRFNPVLSHWEERDFAGGFWGWALAVSLPGSRVRINRAHWSIRPLQEVTQLQLVLERNKAREPRLAAGEDGRWGRMRGRGEEGRARCRGQSEGGKAILWSFKELLFHAKLKSHYKDYMAANNVRQISI